VVNRLQVPFPLALCDLLRLCQGTAFRPMPLRRLSLSAGLLGLLAATGFWLAASRPVLAAEAAPVTAKEVLARTIESYAGCANYSAEI